MKKPRNARVWKLTPDFGFGQTLIQVKALPNSRVDLEITHSSGIRCAIDLEATDAETLANALRAAAYRSWADTGVAARCSPVADAPE